jgi:hypothetical protein
METQKPLRTISGKYCGGSDLSLQELVADGSVRVDGDLYHMSRSLTRAQLAQMEPLSDRIRELCPMVDEIPVRLDS